MQPVIISGISRLDLANKMWENEPDKLFSGHIATPTPHHMEMTPAWYCALYNWAYKVYLYKNLSNISQIP